MDVFSLVATLELKADSFFSGLSDAAEAMVKFAADSVKVGSGFDASMSKVKAISGATADEFETLRKLAREAGASTKYTAQDAADALNYMAMAGWKTEQMTSGLSGILDLAAASGEDLARTSDIVTDALTAFGMTAEESGHFADILAAASSNSNTNVGMMGETFKYAASIAGSLGYTAEDTALAIGLMASAGIKSSQAGTSLRRIMTQLQGDIELTGETLGDYVVKTSNADGSMRNFRDIISELRVGFSQLSESEQATAAKALVGQYALSGFLTIMNAADADWDKLAAAIDGCWYTLDSFTEQLDIAGVSLTDMQGKMENLGISSEAFTNALNNSKGNAKDFVDALYEASGAGTSYDDILKALGMSLEDLQTVMDNTAGATKAMAEIMMDNLQGDMFQLESAVQDFQIILSDKLTPTIRDFTKFGYESVRKFTQALEKDGLDGALSVFEEIVVEGSSMIQEKLPVFEEKGTKILNAISKGIEIASPTIGNVIETLGTMVGNFLQQNAPTIASTMATVVKSLTPGLIAAFQGMFQGLQAALPEIWSTIQGDFTDFIGSMLWQMEDSMPLVARAIEGLLGIESKAAHDARIAYEEELKAKEEAYNEFAEAVSDPVTMTSYFDDYSSESVQYAREIFEDFLEYSGDEVDIASYFTDNSSINIAEALDYINDLLQHNGLDVVTLSEHIDETSDPALIAIANLQSLYDQSQKGYVSISEHKDEVTENVKTVLAWLSELEKHNGEVVRTQSINDVITRYITETDGSETANTYAENQSKTNAEKKIEKLGGSGNYAIHARSMYEGTILRGATMFGWDAQGRPQIGGGEGPEAVVGVGSLNQQIREAVRDGLSGIVGSIAQAIGGKNEQPVYVVLDTGELVGAIGGKMDTELSRIGDWKGGGRA